MTLEELEEFKEEMLKEEIAHLKEVVKSLEEQIRSLGKVPYFP